METIYSCVAGLDIHKNNIVVCLRHTRSDGSLQEDVRTFATMTDDLFALTDWLSQQHVTHVAVESNGVLWKPIWNILESYEFQSLLVNCDARCARRLGLPVDRRRRISRLNIAAWQAAAAKNERSWR